MEVAIKEAANNLSIYTVPDLIDVSDAFKAFKEGDYM
jgi:hypothetical protein